MYSSKRNGPLRPLMFSLLGLLLGLGVSTDLSAHAGATGVVKARMDRMQSMKEAVKTLGEMVKGRRPYSADGVEAEAAQILEAARGLTNQFPAGSLHGHSEALPAIWQRWDAFSRLASRLDDQATRLQTLAQDGSPRAVKVQYVQVVKACRACHADYRKPKEGASL